MLRVMDQPIVPPATTSDAKCFCAVTRAAVTIPGRLYTVMPIKLLCVSSNKQQTNEQLTR